MIHKKHFSQNDLEEISRQLKKLELQGKTVLDNFDFMQLFNISRNTSLAWRKNGRIRFSRLGRRTYFRLSDIEKMLEENLVDAG